jgi:MFS family permease
VARRADGWRLLRRPGAFRRLWLARVVSLLGDSVGLVALVLLVAEQTGDGVSVGLLLLAADGTATLLSPLLGVVADRAARRRTMVACELGQALAIGAIALLRPPLPALLGLVAAQSVLAATFQAAARGAVAELVDDAELEGANAVLGAGTYGLEAAGPLLVALLLPVLSVPGVLLLDALSFLASPLLLAGLPPLPPAAPAAAGTHAEAEGGLPRQAAAGLRVLWRRPLLRATAAGFLVVVAFNGADDVALVFLGRETLRAGDAATSLLYAGSGLGLLVGFALLARGGGRGAPAALAVAGLAWSSAGNLLTGLAPALGVAFAMQVVRGGGLSLVDVGTTTLVQRSVPPALRGRAFANLYGGVGLAAAASYAVGGPLLELLSPRGLLVLAGGGGLAASAATALAVRRAGRATAA